MPDENVINNTTTDENAVDSVTSEDRTDTSNANVTTATTTLTRDQRYEVDNNGNYVVGIPATLSQQRRKDLLEQLFSINGWQYTLVDEIANSHYYVKLENSSLNKEVYLNVYHSNIRKEDPNRSKAEKKIQLGGLDPREHTEDGIIIGFYVNDANAALEDTIIVSWPIEEEKNYPANPSLRVSMDTDILIAKNIGYYMDTVTGKDLISFRPEFVYHFLEDRMDVESPGATSRHSVNYETHYESEFARNRIIFGAPGTGKSFQLDEDKDKLLENGGEFERVTFYPDYTYSSFIGTYKPVSDKDADGKDIIRYEFVPGPFMRLYVKALKNGRSGCVDPYLLIVEEINRANMAAVFGDIFQLLDRKKPQNISKYSIQPSEDLKRYLKKELGEPATNYNELRIPDNMFIWATMNSADQGVFPMDTAFKRRWDFSYLGINKNDGKIAGKKVILGKDKAARNVEWNELRKAINDELSTYRGISEDKLIGPFFFGEDVVPLTGEIDQEKFVQAFKDKVIMYLFEDAAKQKVATLFKGCLKPNEERNLRYSEICDLFDEKGVAIFCDSISKQFTEVANIVTTSGSENAIGNIEIVTQDSQTSEGPESEGDTTDSTGDGNGEGSEE